MKVCAVIAEYNPFHNGHAGHIEQTRQQLNPDVMIAIMSGNYVQRGELAIIDKWQRAKAALLHGVDLVVELPTMSAVQAADYFASQAIKHVLALQCTHLSFGVEKQDNKLLYQIADILYQTDSQQDYTWSYHDYMRHVVHRHLGEAAVQFLETPNNQLGLSYVKALKVQCADVQVVTVPREATQHTDKDLPDGGLASGSAIRQAVKQNRDVGAYVPASIAESLARAVWLDSTVWWQLLNIKLLTLSPEELRCIYQVDEGIEYRLKSVARHAATYREFLEVAVTKRFKKARIQRICTYIVLHITKETMHHYLNQPVQQLRVLGFTQTGLHHLKTLTDVEWLTQFKQRHIKQWEAQIAFDDVYKLLTGAQNEQNFRRVVRL